MFFFLAKHYTSSQAITSLHDTNKSYKTATPYPLILTEDVVQVAVLPIASAGSGFWSAFKENAAKPGNGFGGAEPSSGLLLLRRGMMLASSFPQSGSRCLVCRDKVRALTSNCSRRCNLRWLAEMLPFRCFACVCFVSALGRLYLDVKLHGEH